jgi:para-aminobenzoate synthetase/4-amino-4-deoxychorismate lyase
LGDFPRGEWAAPYVLLEDRLTPGACAQLYRSPRAVVRCDAPVGLDEAFRRIEAGLAGGLHAAGLLSYELGYALEPRLAGLMPERRDTPLLWFGLFEPLQRITAEALDTGFAALPPPAPITDLQGGNDRAQHVEKVRAILDLIAAGDVYQVNLTFPFRFGYAGDPLSLYAALRARQPVAHGGVAALEDMTVLSVSPELWLEVDGDQATTRPMKGTSPRGKDPCADEAAKTALAADPKQRAENLMIVDLLRNDLARIATPGSVRVPDLFTPETYPSFHALTSTITGRLEPRQGLRERIAARFPCGSIVGAPKIRASEIIRGLEPAPRGFYTGALGAIAPNGDMRFNVAIRTAILWRSGGGRYDVGGGVVADSDPNAEYDEACLKGRVLTDLAQDYDLIETFRWSRADGFVRLPLHLDRLAGSAAALGFVFERVRSEQALENLERAWVDDEVDQRVRLALSRDGMISLTHQAAAQPPRRMLCVNLAAHRVDPGDPFLRHKTTRRQIYDHAFEAASAESLDETLFLNRRGFVAEASRNSIFANVGGRLLTPPRTAGVLPGVLRGQLIASGEAIERNLTLEDLRGADGLFLGNSLHGLRAARLV